MLRFILCAGTRLAALLALLSVGTWLAAPRLPSAGTLVFWRDVRLHAPFVSYYAVDRGIAVVDETLTPENAPHLTALSPDGRWRVGTQYDGGDHELYLDDLQAARRYPLTDNPVDDSTPAWSPDGRALVYVSNGALWILPLGFPADGGVTAGVPRLLTVERALSASWSPDGQWIAFRGSAFSSFDLLLIRPDGTDKRTLLHEVLSAPVWSPDSTQIAFTPILIGTPGVFVVSIADGRVRRLFAAPFADVPYVWLP